MNKEDYDLLNAIAQAIYDKKGMNILALDIKNISSITDSVIIAEGNVDRHVIAIAQAIKHALGALGVKPMHVEGTQLGDWIVMDYGQIMVHLFMPGLRDKYQLEDLWREGKIIDLQIAISQIG